MFNRPCLVCAEKEKQIELLKSEVAYLRELASPSRFTVQIPTIQREVDSIMTSNTPPPDLTPEQEEILREREALLTGTY